MAVEDEMNEIEFNVAKGVKSVEILPNFPTKGTMQIKLFDKNGNELYSVDYVETFITLTPTLTDAMVFEGKQPVIDIDFVDGASCKMIDEFTADGNILRKIVCDREM